MKRNLTLISTITALAFFGGRPATLGQATDLIVSTFDTEDDVGTWIRWWGAAPQTYEFDPAVDAGGNANSGSLKATIEFDRVAYGGDNQFALVGSLPGGATVDATAYTNLVFDLRWDSNSPKRASGDFGSLEFGFRKADFSQYWLTPTSPLNVPDTPANGWIHVVAPINPAGAGIDRITGIVLKMWSGDPNSGHVGTATFWLDNVKLIAKTDTSVPRPALALDKPTPGLRVYASASGQYQRQNIRTKVNNYSWIGASGPVTYSITIADYPDAAHPGFQTHLFLVPGEGIPTWETSPDWNRPDVVFLDIQNNAQGRATATFRHKIDQANGNSMIYNANPANGPVGTLASISHDRAVGTWSLTFQNDTEVTITTPGGASTNFSLNVQTAARFANPLYAYLGIQPNQPANLNQSAAFSRFKISGVETPIDDNFAGVAPDPETRPNLDPEVWERVAENAAGVVLIPPDVLFGVNWTVPAVGFVLQSSTTLLPGSWTEVQPPAAQIGDRMRVYLPAASLPAGNRAFFRLIRP